MFGWRRKETSEPHSVIDVHCEIQGPVRSRGRMEVRGYVIGDIDHDGTLVIAAEGCCVGEIRATQLQIAGKVQGHVLVTGTLQICSGGRLHGDVRCGRLAIEAGGEFIGQNRMGEASGSAPMEESGTRVEETLSRPAPPVTQPAPLPPADSPEAGQPADSVTFFGYLRRTEGTKYPPEG